MTSRRKTFTLLLLLLFLAMMAFPARNSLAHVDDDSMPDSVAEVEYRIFLEFNPRDTTVLNKLGMVLYRRNKLREAAREFAKVLKIDPANFDALDAMGLVKTAQQEYDQAISYHRQAIAIKADDVLVHYHLGIALERKGLLREAATAYRKALEIQAGSGATKPGDRRAAKHAGAIRTALENISNH